MAFVAAIPEIAGALGEAGGAEAVAGGAEAGGAAEGGMRMPGQGLFNDRRMRNQGGGGGNPEGALAAAKAAQGA